MMAIDIDIQHAFIVLKELDDRENAVINIAEPRGFLLLGVMQPTGPVDTNICASLGNEGGAPYASTRIYLAVLIHAIKHRTVLAKIDYTYGHMSDNLHLLI